MDAVLLSGLRGSWEKRITKEGVSIFHGTMHALWAATLPKTVSPQRAQEALLRTSVRGGRAEGLNGGDGEPELSRCREETM